MSDVWEAVEDPIAQCNIRSYNHRESQEGLPPNWSLECGTDVYNLNISP